MARKRRKKIVTPKTQSVLRRAGGLLLSGAFLNSVLAAAGAFAFKKVSDRF
jgi:hypothetical protein